MLFEKQLFLQLSECNVGNIFFLSAAKSVFLNVLSFLLPNFWIHRKRVEALHSEARDKVNNIIFLYSSLQLFQISLFAEETVLL